MRITDLLDRRSVSLTAAPKGKSEALDMAVDLMVKSEKISDPVKLTANRYTYVKKKALQESERELPFLMENVMQLRNRDLLQWSSKMVWNLKHWMMSR